jgi:hypothetical protein
MHGTDKAVYSGNFTRRSGYGERGKTSSLTTSSSSEDSAAGGIALAYAHSMRLNACKAI